MRDSIISNNVNYYNQKILKKYKIQEINKGEEEYPEEFLNLYSLPEKIYAIGNTKILNQKNTYGIIGARNCSLYGINIAQRLGMFLKENNINVVSGLAKGIDVNSHIGMLYKSHNANNQKSNNSSNSSNGNKSNDENNINKNNNIKNKTFGKPIAVIGNGLDNIYPYENQKIAWKILENDGCIISEYEIGSMPNKMNFPARNRLISALAQKLIIVEAKEERSGTMITVDFSLDLGKEIWAVPGNITSDTSGGTNKLIKEGANILTKFSDLI